MTKYIFKYNVLAKVFLALSILTEFIITVSNYSQYDNFFFLSVFIRIALLAYVLSKLSEKTILSDSGLKTSRDNSDNTSWDSISLIELYNSRIKLTSATGIKYYLYNNTKLSQTFDDAKSFIIQTAKKKSITYIDEEDLATENKVSTILGLKSKLNINQRFIFALMILNLVILLIFSYALIDLMLQFSDLNKGLFNLFKLFNVNRNIFFIVLIVTLSICILSLIFNILSLLSFKKKQKKAIRLTIIYRILYVTTFLSSVSFQTVFPLGFTSDSMLSMVSVIFLSLSLIVYLKKSPVIKEEFIN